MKKKQIKKRYAEKSIIIKQKVENATIIAKKIE